MPYVLQQGCTISCPHGGMATVLPTNLRFKAGGGYALLPNDTFVITGCPFTVGTVYQPCVTIEWSAPATRLKAGGTGVLLESSVGLCKAATGAVQGRAVISGVQRQVQGQ